MATVTKELIELTERIAASCTENSRQIPAAVYHALDPHGILGDPEEDGIAAHGRQARFLSYVGAELVE